LAPLDNHQMSYRAPARKPLQKQIPDIGNAPDGVRQSHHTQDTTRPDDRSPRAGRSDAWERKMMLEFRESSHDSRPRQAMNLLLADFNRSAARATAMPTAEDAVSTRVNRSLKIRGILTGRAFSSCFSHRWPRTPCCFDVDPCAAKTT